MTRLQQQANSPISAVKYDVPSGEQKKQSFSMQRGHWLLISLGFLSLLIIVFITFARSIQITTVTFDINSQGEMLDLDANVELSSLIKLPIVGRVLVLPGKHEVIVSAQGFEVVRQTIEVGSGRQQDYEIVLTALPGQIDISLKPEVFAKVSIDGEFFSGLPGLLEQVPAGKHELTIDAPLYRAATKSITVRGRNLTETISISLDPAWGNLHVDSTPTAASILIDGQEVGKSPLVVKVEEGTHTLSLRAEKYKIFSQTFTIATDQDLSASEIVLVPADAVLDIKTQPHKAAVLVNGEYRGISPLTLKLKPNKEQNLQIYKAGYKLQNKQLSFLPEQNKSLEINLVQDTVAVRFSISPSDAELFIDGVRRGSGSQTVNLNTLPHNIVVRKPGYAPYKNRVIPTKSSSQMVSIQLFTKEQQFWLDIPNSYNNFVDQKMKLFKSPGLVKLGSTRHEAGRRSNEVAYTAKLNKHFYVSSHEISNKQYRKYKPAHNSGNYKRKSLDSNKHPVANVSWQQAALFCNWMSRKEQLAPFYKTTSGYVSGNNEDANGYRLLTEVEWAWLARNNGDELITYPWGNSSEINSSKAVGNFADEKADVYLAFTLENYNDGYQASSPIGSYSENHKGLFDLGGNVAEWVNDWYGSNSQYLISGQTPVVDPLGPKEGEFHVIRGGSWARGYLPQLRLAYRDFGAKGKHDVGFRVARYVGKPG